MNLKREIQLNLIGTVLLSVGLFALIVLLASHRLEHSLLDTLIQSESELLLSRIADDPQASLPQLKLTRAWFGPESSPELPASWRELPPGIHHDVVLDGHSYHVKRQILPAGVLTVAVNIDALEQREHTLQWVVGCGAIAVVLLLLWLGANLARRVARPFQALAKALDKLEPERDLRRPLSGRFRGQEVDRITQSLDRYRQRLADVLDRERSFATSASHELRSPVTVMRSSLELLSMDKALPPHLLRVIERAQRSSLTMSQVLDGLMLLAREAQPSEWEDVDLAALLRELLDDYHLQLQQTGAFRQGLGQDQRIRLHCEAPPPHLKAVPSQLRILLDNLLRNALEHAPGQTIELKLDGESLSICDQGPGIPDDILPHIFERERRGQNSGGAGLGLYIAGEICKRHGWRIRAENRQGVNGKTCGCCIHIRFATDSTKD